MSADTKLLFSGKLAINCSLLWVDGSFACVVFCRKRLFAIPVVLSWRCCLFKEFILLFAVATSAILNVHGAHGHL